MSRAPAGSGLGDAFEGSCSFSLTVTFDPPATAVAAPGRQVARGPGTCTGTLTTSDGGVRHFDGAPAYYRAHSSGDIGCGTATAEGTGYLRFGNRKVRFRITESRVAVAGAVTLSGRSGGSFTGTAMPSGDPATAVKRCAGDGLRRVPVALSGSTSSPLRG